MCQFYVYLFSFNRTVSIANYLASVNQNQPALEKDRYKIRQAFIAAPDNSLIVADYGQVMTCTLHFYVSVSGILM